MAAIVRPTDRRIRRPRVYKNPFQKLGALLRIPRGGESTWLICNALERVRCRRARASAGSRRERSSNYLDDYIVW